MKEEKFSSRARGSVDEKRNVTRERKREVSPCRGRHAIEVRGVAGDASPSLFDRVRWTCESLAASKLFGAACIGPPTLGWPAQ